LCVTRWEWQIGIIGKGRFYYWKLMLWSLKKPQSLPLVVRYSIFGYHFLHMIRSGHAQMKKLTAASANECRTDMV